MDLNDRLEQIKSRYINHPLERINELKNIINSKDYQHDNLKNVINGIIIARRNYNEQGFNLTIKSLKEYISDENGVGELRKQFNIIAELLDDFIDYVERYHNIDDAIYDALSYELKEFEHMINGIGQINKEKHDVMHSFDSKDKDMSYMMHDILDESLLKYRKYLDSMAKYLISLAHDIDVYNQLQYKPIELYDRINRILFNKYSVNILKGTIHDNAFNELNIQNDFVCQQLEYFSKDLKTLSIDEVSTLLLETKSSIRQLIRLIDDNMPFDKQENSEEDLKNSEITMDILPTKKADIKVKQDSFEVYDDISKKENDLYNELASIDSEEIKIRNKQQELDRVLTIKKQTGGHISFKKALEECALRVKLKDYKSDIKSSLKEQIAVCQDKLSSFKFDISDVLRKIKFLFIGDYNRVLGGKQNKLIHSDKYAKQLKFSNDKQKRRVYTI